MNKRTFKILLIVITLLVNVGCDQATKVMARKHLKGKETIRVVGTVFILTYAENSGAFLSMGSGIPQPFKTIFLTVMPVLFLVGFTVYIFRTQKLTNIETVFLVSIIGGGVSNIFDRITHGGYVTDFMNFGIGGLRTGSLNVADLSIPFGLIFYLIASYIINK